MRNVPICGHFINQTNLGNHNWDVIDLRNEGEEGKRQEGTNFAQIYLYSSAELQHLKILHTRILD